MTEIKDLTQFVEEHPDDHEARWRLAKKLYMGNDYAHVLEHLQILQARWIPKVNVRRYLGASYYRLKRYDEAVVELQAAVAEWPDELPLREQLARVLEVAGRQTDADHVWQELLDRDPNRMALRTDDTPKPAMPARGKKEGWWPHSSGKKEDKLSQPGLVDAALAMGRICPACGAQNTDEFERCWNCHTELSDMGNMPAATFDSFMPTPSPDNTPRFRAKPPPGTSEIWHIPVAVLGGVFLIAGIYLTVGPLADFRSSASATWVYTTVREVFARRLAATHLVVGIVLLMAWPGSLWLAATLVPRAEVPARTVVILGSVLAAFAYLLSWAPPEWLGYLFVMILLISAGAVMATFRMEARRALTAWAIHAVLLISVLMVIIVAMEGFSVIIEYPAMARYARAHDTAMGENDESGRVSIPAIQLQKQYTFTFRSSGSAWLDAKVPTVSFEITGAKPEDNLSIELKDDNRTRYYGHADVDPFRFSVGEIVPDWPYHLTLDGKDSGRVRLIVRGVLRPDFKE